MLINRILVTIDMAEKKYPVHPEYSEKYPAIDGIAKPDRPTGDHYIPAEKAIRSDIEKILEMSDDFFNSWYKERLAVSKSLLDQYQIFASIPNLVYASESRKLGMDNGTIRILKEGLDYLDKIAKVRKEYKELNKEK